MRHNITRLPQLGKRAIHKGQIEAFVFTVVFLLIAVAVIIGGIVVLVGMRGSAISTAVAIMEGTSRPISFSSGLVMLDAATNVSILEQSLHIATTSKLPSPYGRGDLLPLSRSVYDAITSTRLENSWLFEIANTTERHAEPIFKLGTFPTFCGTLANADVPQDAANKWAWCESATSRSRWTIDGTTYTSRCSPGRTECLPGDTKCHQEKCTSNQQCCQLVGYNFTPTVRNYQGITFQDGGKNVQACGPDVGWYGLCKYSCAPGEVEASGKSGMCPGWAWGFLEKNQICCRPVDRLGAVDPRELDAVVIPLLYASPTDPTLKMAGKIEMWVGAPR